MFYLEIERLFPEPKKSFLDVYKENRIFGQTQSLGFSCTCGWTLYLVLNALNPQVSKDSNKTIKDPKPWISWSTLPPYCNTSIYLCPTLITPTWFSKQESLNNPDAFGAVIENVSNRYSFTNTSHIVQVFLCPEEEGGPGASSEDTDSEQELSPIKTRVMLR